MNVTAKLIKIYILYTFILIFSINLNSTLADTNNINAANNLDWIGNLSPLSESDWDINIAKHLLERAGFGGTPGEIKKIYELGSNLSIIRPDYLSNSIIHLSIISFYCHIATNIERKVLSNL